ncbi:hypothetical protein BX600DRAFT_432996 [Xylariales sp. PMI_506]|nr:hypothetical protein BX600DRAFT_432996 [Xylariales sp. PMI_506]
MRKVYMILFPLVNPEDIPSPFYDLEPKQGNADPVGYIAQQKTSLRREILSRLIVSLETRLKAFRIDEKTVKEVVETCTTAVYEAFDMLPEMPYPSARSDAEDPINVFRVDMDNPTLSQTPAPWSNGEFFDDISNGSVNVSRQDSWYHIMAPELDNFWYSFISFK